MFIPETSWTQGKGSCCIPGHDRAEHVLPERLKSAELTDKTIILESFWDSGLPRFGEEGARGWSFSMDNKDLLPTESENSEKGIV